MMVRNPRTGKYDYQIEVDTAAKLAEYARQMRQAQSKWALAGIQYRIQTLQSWKTELIKCQPQLIAALMEDTGRKSETLLEVDLVAASIDRWCNTAAVFFEPSADKQTAIPFVSLQQHLVAYPLVGVISPWNFPLLLSLIDTIPALLAGAAVMVKPSEITPRFIAVMQAAIAAIPALHNVLSYLTGDGNTGAAMIPLCDTICFTGSTTTGKKVYEAASKAMIPVFLEMGGKDAAIVLPGANLEMAANAILWGSTVNAGQSCMSIERIYVHQDCYPKFVALLVQKAKVLQCNSTHIDEGEIGPLIFERQAGIINTQLQDAIDKGAIIACGNSQCQQINGGWYCRPTVVTDVNHTMCLMQDETFGPIMPVMQVHSEEEAIGLANDTVYGLGAAIFAASNAAAIQVAHHLQAGAISINDCALTAVMHEGEKNAFKLSGIGGTRMGPSAIKRFMRQQLLLVKEQAVASPWWYKNV
jgi:succinate-semialdehyde dehydrogenase / glutarate-semialdehyde dehydrogenase